MLFGSVCIKAVCKNVDENDPRLDNFNLDQRLISPNILQTAFTLEDPKSVKDTDDLTVFL